MTVLTKPATESPVASQQYELVVGMEVHAQVLTRSKMFCACATDYAGAPPNTRVCPVCLGMPGSLPVMNRAALEAYRAALTIHPHYDTAIQGVQRLEPRVDGREA